MPRMSSEELNIILARTTPGRVKEIQSTPRFSLMPTTDEDRLNKTEKSYLAMLRLQGHCWIGIQNITLKLADDTRYTPDFSTVSRDGAFVFHEVKGFMRDDARAKIYVAARQFTMFKFMLVRKAAGGWRIKKVAP